MTAQPDNTSDELGGLAHQATPKASGNQFDKLLEASVPYELERGSIYLVEVKQWAMDKQTATLITDYYQRRYQIDIQFVFTTGQEFALQAVPAVKADDAVTDLQLKDPEVDTTGTSEAQSMTIDSELDDILNTLEAAIKSSHRKAFMPDRLPAENGEMARLTRESAKDIAKEKLQHKIAQEANKAQADILIWATGGIKEFTEEGKIAIPAKIKELLSLTADKEQA